MPIRLSKKTPRAVIRKPSHDLLFDDRDEAGVKHRKKYSDYFNPDEDTSYYRRGASRWLSTVRVPLLIEEVRNILQGVILIMTPPYKKRPILSWDASKSFCDGKNIWINSLPLRDTLQSPVERVNICAGFGVHEMCHIVYTEFSHLSRLQHEPELVKYLQNVIEDERIERLCVDDYPGYAEFLVNCKKYFFDVTEKEEAKDIVQKVIRELFHTIRYPERLLPENIIDIEEAKPGLWEKVLNVLRPYPTDTLGCIRAAQAIYDLLKSNFTEDELNKSGVNSDNAAAKEKGMILITDPVELAKIKAELHKFASAGLSKEEQSELSDKEDGTIQDREFKDDITGIGVKVRFQKVKGGNIAQYKKIADPLRSMKSTLARLLQTETVNQSQLHKGMRTGTLDTAKLAEAVQRVETVYLKKSTSKTTKHSVVIVVDQSYSMSENLKSGGGNKISAARTTAILLYEAIKTQPDLDLYMYGHSADHESGCPTSVYVYHEKGYSCNGINLVEIGLKSNNRDGVALQGILKRVREQTSEHCIVLYIADGMPYATGYQGNSSVEHVRKVVEKAEKDNFTIVGISIDTHYEPKKMFKHYVTYTGTKSIPKQLSDVILKQVRKHKKVIIT